MTEEDLMDLQLTEETIQRILQLHADETEPLRQQVSDLQRQA